MELKIATREENLKKINDELEKLSDEELEQVSGGMGYETAGDSAFLAMYGLCKAYSIDDINYTIGVDKELEVKHAWAEVGINYGFFGGMTHNEYYLASTGQKITREAAYDHVIKLLGQPRKAVENTSLETA